MMLGVEEVACSSCIGAHSSSRRLLAGTAGSGRVWEQWGLSVARGCRARQHRAACAQRQQCHHG
eukprot:3812046-Pyramimonas_sp.AAC.1